MSVSPRKTSPLKGPRTGHEKLRLTPLTLERARTDPAPLAVRHVNFIQDFTRPVKIPRNLLSSERGSSNESDSDGQRKVSVGQIREE